MIVLKNHKCENIYWEILMCLRRLLCNYSRPQHHLTIIIKLKKFKFTSSKFFQLIQFKKILKISKCKFFQNLKNKNYK